jgi:hypothetical protein
MNNSFHRILIRLLVFNPPEIQVDENVLFDRVYHQYIREKRTNVSMVIINFFSFGRCPGGDGASPPLVAPLVFML